MSKTTDKVGQDDTCPYCGQWPGPGHKCKEQSVRRPLHASDYAEAKPAGAEMAKGSIPLSRGTPITLEAARLKALEQVKDAREHYADGIDEPADAEMAAASEIQLPLATDMNASDIQSLRCHWQYLKKELAYSKKCSREKQDIIDRQAEQAKYQNGVIDKLTKTNVELLCERDAAIEQLQAKDVETQPFKDAWADARLECDTLNTGLCEAEDTIKILQARLRQYLGKD